jgi:hypothetical protein
MEVWLRFLEHAGLTVKRDATSVSDLVQWGAVRRTMLIVCGDWIDRRRASATRDNALPRLVYSAQTKKIFECSGTDGELPYEEYLIVQSVAALQRTERASSNRVIMVLGNHDVALLANHRSIPAYTTDMAILSEAIDPARQSPAELEAWRLDALAVARAFTTANPGALIAPARVNAPSGTTLQRSSMRAPHFERLCPRPVLHAAFFAARRAAVPFYAVGKYIFSHAGLTSTVARHWRTILGIRDAVGLMQTLCNPDRTDAEIKQCTDGSVEPSVLLQRLTDPETSAFWSRPGQKDPITGEAHSTRVAHPLLQEDVFALGLRFYEPLTHNVLAHNCGGSAVWSANTVMVDKCASRAMLERVGAQFLPNGPIYVGTLPLQKRAVADFPHAADRLVRFPSGPEFASPAGAELAMLSLPGIDRAPTDAMGTGNGHTRRNSGLRVPLREQCGLVVLADWDTASKSWVARIY